MRVLGANLVTLLVLTLIADRTVVAWLESSLSRQNARPDLNSPTFRHERDIASQTRWRFHEGFLVRDNVDLDGEYINVSDGVRATNPAPRSPNQKILIFGGSTTFCGNVPDSQTWPSYLAKQVAPRSVEVLNFGVSGASTVDRVRRLRSLASDLNQGDVVVFYFGVNDSLAHRLETTPIGIFGTFPRLRRLAEILAPASASARLLLRLQRQSRFIDDEPIRRRPVDIIQQLALARELANSRGADFIAVLQPNQLAGHGRFLSAANDFPAQVSQAVRSFYLEMKRSVELRAVLLDATGAFDDLSTSPYEDWNHVNAEGNLAIATLVSTALLERGYIGS